MLKAINWGDTVTLNHEKLSSTLHEIETLSIAKMPMSQLQIHKNVIAEVTDYSNVVDIVNAIINKDITDNWFDKAQSTLAKGSALSAHIIHRQLNEGKQLSRIECFLMELNLSVKSARFGEFFEGVRALLIDKDFTPKWKFNSVDQVDLAVVDWFFQDKWQDLVHPLHPLEE